MISPCIIRASISFLFNVACRWKIPITRNPEKLVGVVLDIKFAKLAYGFADILPEQAINREANRGVFAQESTHVRLFANPGC